jgi:hypothetical protein
VFDLVLYRGDTYRFQARLWEDTAGGVPTDLTGATAEAEIRDKSAGAFVVVMECEITPPNLIDVTLTGDMWASCPTKGVWDLQVTMPDGDVRTVLAGKVDVTPDVTDSVVAPALRRVS